MRDVGQLQPVAVRAVLARQFPEHANDAAMDPPSL